MSADDVETIEAHAVDEDLVTDADNEPATGQESTGQQMDPDGAPPDGEEVAADRARTAPRWRTPLILAAAAVLMVTGLLAWGHTVMTAAPDRGQVRDAVLIAATKDIGTMNSLDYRHIDKGLSAWRSVTTGTLHDQLAAVGTKQRQLLADQKKITSGKVVQAAVTHLEHGTATVIAAVRVSVKDGTKPGSKPTVKRNRYSADLVRVGATWKLESLQQVPVRLP